MFCYWTLSLLDLVSFNLISWTLTIEGRMLSGKWIFHGLRESFPSEEKESLGDGSGGFVKRGRYNGDSVAIKSIHPDCERSEVLALLSEIKILMYLSEHPNVVGFIGANTAHLEIDKAFIFVEFCPLGSLEHFLQTNRHLYRKNRPVEPFPIPSSSTQQSSTGDSVYHTNSSEQFQMSAVGNSRQDSASPGPSFNGGGRIHCGYGPSTQVVFELVERTNNHKDTSHLVSSDSEEDEEAFGTPETPTGTPQNDEGVIERILFEDLLRWSGQIASGMEFLEQQRVIHADLAARNVLLKSFNQVKITDFGLSCHLGRYSKYTSKSDKSVPWKYMAIECLRCGIYTSQSDVWSYGVTIWEIFSLGGNPFPCQEWDTNFIESLESGDLRLHKPKHATDPIYNLMMQCWEKDPSSRPRFQQLHNFFSNYHNDV